MADEPAVPEDEAGTAVDAEAEAADYADETVADDAPDDSPTEEASKSERSHVRLALIVGVAVVVALGALTGWLGYRAYEIRTADQLDELLVSVGRQGAINLTTINFEHAEADVQRILDSATDQFYDDFAKRSQPFVEVVKQAQSKSVGTVTEAGLESVTGTEGQVLVAVTVQTSNRGAAEQQPRSWRMRLTVKKTGNDEAKVSKVEFVP
ncbi:Mce protein [Mycolicibacterium sp. CH28]|uniref:Mce protein n=1 Tax=Mycolicibacterium sp. CH28 TaxID=2512237 RepID=UPI0010807305|nr:Mce protein [Mycolicibacterium sp. CH28]TGD85626.1 Mce protein [Mycolicibacterium sp. CH28]